MSSEAAGRQPLSLVVCLMTPLVILMMGVIGSLVIVLKAQPDLHSEIGRGALPQGFELSLPQAGDYTVWWLSHTEFEGQEYGSGGDEEAEAVEKLPDGARVLVYRHGESQAFVLNTMVSAQRSSAEEKAVSLGTFTVNQAMDVDVKASGLLEPVVVKIAPVKVGKVLQVAFAIGVLMVVDVLVAIVVLFALLHRRKLAIDDDAGVHSHAPAGLPAVED